jgi:hypothetical protein
MILMGKAQVTTYPLHVYFFIISRFQTELLKIRYKAFFPLLPLNKRSVLLRGFFIPSVLVTQP